MVGGLIVDDLREAGEFSIDLYTMPDALTTKLWDIFVSGLDGPDMPLAGKLTPSRLKRDWLLPKGIRSALAFSLTFDEAAANFDGEPGHSV